MTKEISNLKDSKACPIESIPSKILKENYEIFAPKLLIDFNYAISNGIFPKNQKLADITLIFIDDDKHIDPSAFYLLYLKSLRDLCHIK